MYVEDGCSSEGRRDVSIAFDSDMVSLLEVKILVYLEGYLLGSLDDGTNLSIGCKDDGGNG